MKTTIFPTQFAHLFTQSQQLGSTVVILWHYLELSKILIDNLGNYSARMQGFDAYTTFGAASLRQAVDSIEDPRLKEIAERLDSLYNCCNDWVSTASYMTTSPLNIEEQMAELTVIEQDLLTFADTAAQA